MTRATTICGYCFHWDYDNRQPDANAELGIALCKKWNIKRRSYYSCPMWKCRMFNEKK